MPDPDPRERASARRRPRGRAGVCRRPARVPSAEEVALPGLSGTAPGVRDLFRARGFGAAAGLIGGMVTGVRNTVPSRMGRIVPLGLSRISCSLTMCGAILPERNAGPDALFDHVFADGLHGCRRCAARSRLDRELLPEGAAVDDDPGGLPGGNLQNGLCFAGVFCLGAVLRMSEGPGRSRVCGLRSCGGLSAASRGRAGGWISENPGDAIHRRPQTALRRV